MASSSRRHSLPTISSYIDTQNLSKNSAAEKQLNHDIELMDKCKKKDDREARKEREKVILELGRLHANKTPEVWQYQAAGHTKAMKDLEREKIDRRYYRKKCQSHRMSKKAIEKLKESGGIDCDGMDPSMKKQLLRDSDDSDDDFDWRYITRLPSTRYK